MSAAGDRRWVEVRDQLEAAATTLDRIADLLGEGDDFYGHDAAEVAVETALRAVEAELNRPAS